MNICDLPDDVLIEIIERLDEKVYILNTCTTFRRLREYFVKSVNVKYIEPSEYNSCIKRIKTYKNVHLLSAYRRYQLPSIFPHLHLEYLFKHLETLEIDHLHLAHITNNMFSKPLKHLKVVIKKKDQSIVDLKYIACHSATIYNKKLGVSLYPDDIIHPIIEDDLTTIDIVNVCRDVKECHLVGAITLPELSHTSVAKLVCEEGVCIASKLPPSLTHVSLLNVRILVSTCIFEQCLRLEHLHLENMFALSRHISPSCWRKWSKTMKYYADIFTLSYTMPHTQSLHMLEEFHVSPGNSLFGRWYLDYSIPDSLYLKTVHLERINITHDEYTRLMLVADNILEDCYVL